jgi:tRNA pseudouridine32 synthase/23S rRNA pseudouridine746 synthase
MITLKVSNKSIGEISNIRVLYESDHILAIDKPPHIPYHDDLLNEQKGILSCIRQLQLNHEIEYQGRLYGVHRLDRVTSGILLFAKSSNVARDLSESFKQKHVSKYYVALSTQKPKKKKQGWVKGDMVPSRRKSWKLTNSYTNPAVTRFFTAGLGNSAARKHDDGRHLNEDSTVLSTTNIPKTMILYIPHTGKTHQLRVASKSLGLPILGDPIYSNRHEAKEMTRTYLHALALHVNLNGEDITIYNPPTSWFHSEELTMYGHMEQVLYELMTKHCKCSEILSLVSNATE